MLFQNSIQKSMGLEERGKVLQLFIGYTLFENLGINAMLKTTLKLSIFVLQSKHLINILLSV